MNARTLIGMIVGAVVLGGVYMVVSRPDSGTSTGTGAGSAASTISLFDNVKPEDCDRLEILYSDKKKLEFRRVGKAWNVVCNGKPVEITKQRAERFFTSGDGKSEITGGMTGSYQASNPENHKSFNLDAASATELKFYAGTKIVEDLLLGKSGSVGNSCYIRRADSKDVYLFAVDLNDNFQGSTVSRWRETAVFPKLKKESITRVEVDDRETTHVFQLARKGSEWMVGHDGKEEKGRQATIDSAIQQLAGMRASDYPDKATVEKEKGALSSIIKFATGEGEATNTLTIYKSKDNTKYFLESPLVEESPQVFRPYSLLRAPADFVEPPPTPVPTPTPEAAVTSGTTTLKAAGS